MTTDIAHLYSPKIGFSLTAVDLVWGTVIDPPVPATRNRDLADLCAGALADLVTEVVNGLRKRPKFPPPSGQDAELFVELQRNALYCHAFAVATVCHLSNEDAWEIASAVQGRWEAAPRGSIVTEDPRKASIRAFEAFPAQFAKFLDDDLPATTASGRGGGSRTISQPVDQGLRQFAKRILPSTAVAIAAVAVAGAADTMPVLLLGLLPVVIDHAMTHTADLAKQAIGRVPPTMTHEGRGL